MLLKFEKLFTKKSVSADTVPYKIRVKPHKNFVRKTYPIPLSYRDFIDVAIQEMLSSGIIERSDSSYCNPLRVVIKKDNSVRVCLDARFINEIIEPDNESPPSIDELMQKFNGVKYMSTADLASGYWQISLHHSCRKYTAFLHNSRVYQFFRIPFGLKTAGSAFVIALSMALGDQFEEFLTIYIDDFLIATLGSINDHKSNLEAVLNILQEKIFTLNLTKSLFCQFKIQFLGYELSTMGIRPINDRLEIIAKFKSPSNRRE